MLANDLSLIVLSEANGHLNDDLYISKIGWSICTFER